MRERDLAKILKFMYRIGNGILDDSFDLEVEIFPTIETNMSAALDFYMREYSEGLISRDVLRKKLGIDDDSKMDLSNLGLTDLQRINLAKGIGFDENTINQMVGDGQLGITIEQPDPIDLDEINGHNFGKDDEDTDESANSQSGKDV